MSQMSPLSPQGLRRYVWPNKASSKIILTIKIPPLTGQEIHHRLKANAKVVFENRRRDSLFVSVPFKDRAIRIVVCARNHSSFLKVDATYIEVVLDVVMNGKQNESALIEDCLRIVTDILQT